jgi:ubiquitin carboxyl-terminal hydrolase 5/13
LAEKVIQADSAKKKADVQVWKETVLACEHTLGIQQDDFSPASIAKHASNHCSGCELSSNVWLCLVCGAVGCGRRQFDGSGGSGHAAEHFKETGHGLSVKLGTITPEGEADIFCYHCDEMRTDPELARHLALFGMRVEGAERTEKSMAELQLEQNRKYDFGMTTQDGAELEAATGPGCVGISNLGNSCYLASVMQALCSLPQFARFFGDQSHFMTCSKEPAICFQCQFTKVQLAFASGKDERISPWMLKAVVGSGHPEFSTSQQQDAAELFSHLMRLLQRTDPSSSALKAFEHRIRQTLTCASCGNSRHQVMDAEAFPLDLGAAVLDAEDPLDPQVSLEACIVKALAPENVRVNCSSCGHSGAKRYDACPLIEMTDPTRRCM